MYPGTLLVISLTIFGVGVLSRTTTTLSYDKTYDNADLSLTRVACSDGANGLVTKGYSTLGSLPTFPNVGGVYTISGWNSPACGACYAVTHGGVMMNITGVDVSKAGFTVSEAAMNALTNNEAEEFGRIDVSYVQVPSSWCGLPN